MPLSLLALRIVLAGLLVGAAWTDLRSRTIPNALTRPALLAALLLRSLLGWDALAAGLLAAGICLALGFLLFALGAMGGGDGKLLMSAGACLGTADLPLALAATAVLGGLLAWAAALRRGVAGQTLRNAADSLALWTLWSRSGAGGPAPRTIRSPDSVTIPYGVAIAGGFLLPLVLP